MAVACSEAVEQSEVVIKARLQQLLIIDYGHNSTANKTWMKAAAGAR